MGLASFTEKVAAENAVMVGGASMVPSKNIVENAANSRDHSTLVNALSKAGLGSTLSEKGPFTVFAPTNEAFAKLPDGTMDALIEVENKPKLVKILTYHVVKGTYTTKDLKDGQTLKTIEGENLKVTIKDGKVKINNANVQIADVVSSNGVTHVVDSVLMPQLKAAN
jgi:uncharacterized surface protein with fasciclin (FAS1) repeats